MQRGEHAEVVERRERQERLVLGEREAQLGPDSRAGNGFQRARCERLPCELARARLHLEPEARLVAREAQQPRRIVAEARVVQHAQHARREVLARMRDGARQLPDPLRRARPRSR